MRRKSDGGALLWHAFWRLARGSIFDAVILSPWFGCSENRYILFRHLRPSGPKIVTNVGRVDWTIETYILAKFNKKTFASQRLLCLVCTLCAIVRCCFHDGPYPTSPTFNLLTQTYCFRMFFFQHYLFHPCVKAVPKCREVVQTLGEPVCARC